MTARSRARRRGFGLGRMAKVAAELKGEADRLGLDAVVPLACATCGRLLLGLDPEDEPEGDAGRPICGECNRERNFAAIEEVELG
jgi:hypothetical protein